MQKSGGWDLNRDLTANHRQSLDERVAEELDIATAERLPWPQGFRDAFHRCFVMVLVTSS